MPEQAASASFRLDSLSTATGQRIHGRELRIPCPAHQGEDHNLALWIDRHGNPSRISAYCHSHGCAYADIAVAVQSRYGIELDPQDSGGRYEVARWAYQNTRGETVHAVRWNNTGRDFKSKVTRDPKGIRGPFLVRLYIPAEAVSDSAPVVLCEGEKAAQAVCDAGITAASYLGGAGQAGKAVYTPLRGRSVVIWADDDQEGRKAAAAAARALQGIAKSIRAVEMPGGESHADAADVPAELRRTMVATAYSYTPPSAEVTESELPVVEKSAAGLADALDGLGYKIRYNIRAKRAEYRNGADTWQCFTDLALFKLADRVAGNYRISNASGYKVRWELGKDSWDRYAGPILYDTQVDAFKVDYLDQLPPWDCVPRINTVLQDLFGCEDTPLVQAVNRLIFGMVVKRTLEPGFKNDVVPVLFGKQGAGKSAFCQALMPPGAAGGDWFSSSLDFYTDEKTRLESTDGKVIVEWGEMSSLSGRALEAAKNWITRTNDNATRRSYARYAEASERRFIVIATTDRDTPLPQDPAGNRRFVVVELAQGANVEAWFNAVKVSEQQPEATRRDLLWAEAYSKVGRDGHNWSFPRALLEQQAELNEEYRPVDELLEPLIEQLETPENASTGLKLDDVRRLILACDPDNPTLSKAAHNDKRLSDVIRSRGWRRGRGRDRRLWFPPGVDLFKGSSEGQTVTPGHPVTP